MQYDNLEMGFVVIVVVVFVPHMVRRAAVAFAECIAIIIAQVPLHRWMPVCLVIIGILVATTLKIPARCFNAIVETLPLGIAIFRRRFVPPALPLVLGL